MASSAQFVSSAVIVVILIVIAIALGRVKLDAPADTQEPPRAPVVGGIAFGLGSAFMVLAIVHDMIPAFLNVAGMLGLFIFASLLIWNWSRRATWSELHRLAVAGGLMLVYAWYGFVQVPSVGGTSPWIDTVGNVVFSIGALILLLIAWRRVSASQSVQRISA